MDDGDRALRAQGIASRAMLISDGLSDRRIADAVARGALRRLRKGWYASPTADPRIAAAVAAGGRVACVSALAARGVWILRESELHVAVRDGSHRRAPRGVHLHHGVVRAEAAPGAIESVAEALERMWRCATAAETIIAADSALEKGLVTRSQLAAVFGRTVRGRRLLERVDGRSQSGTETIARLALRGRGIRLRTQVVVPGVGRVDILVGERLVIEVDSVEWHTRPEAFEADRIRDLALTVRGYLVVRVTYRRVVDDWDGFERDLLELIRRGEHRRRVKNDA